MSSGTRLRNTWDRTKGTPEPIHLLNRIKELENHEPLVEIATVAPSVRIARESVIPYVRKTVGEMVEAAARSLPSGYHISLVEGWRPLARQQRIYDHVFKSAQEAFPTRNYASLRRTVCRWVAPTDQLAPPGHCTGAAVDVWLQDDDGNDLDVWSPYERFKAAPTYTLGLSEEAHRNRFLLVEAMLSVGFSNCRDEWWHYSFGDAGWAVRMNKTECIYGLAHLDRAIYEELEIKHEAAMKERGNPFL